MKVSLFSPIPDFFLCICCLSFPLHTLICAPWPVMGLCSVSVTLSQVSMMRCDWWSFKSSISSLSLTSLLAHSFHIIQPLSFFRCQVFPFSPRQLVKGLLLPLGPTAHFLLSPAPVPVWQRWAGSWKLGAEPSAASLCTILPPIPGVSACFLISLFSPSFKPNNAAERLSRCWKGLILQSPFT